MIDDGHISLGGMRIPIARLAAGWAIAVGVLGGLSALIVLTLDEAGFLGLDEVSTAFKVVVIGWAVLLTGLCATSALGLLGLGERQTLIGLSLLGVAVVTGLLSVVSILAVETVPGARVLGIGWVLTIFGGLGGVAVRMLGGEQIQRIGGMVGAGASAVGAVIGTLSILFDSDGTTIGRIIGACLILSVSAVGVGLMARFTDEDELPADPTTFE